MVAVDKSSLTRVLKEYLHLFPRAGFSFNILGDLNLEQTRQIVRNDRDNPRSPRSLGHSMWSPLRCNHTPSTTMLSHFVLSRLSPIAIHHFLHVRVPSPWKPAKWSPYFPRVPFDDVWRSVIISKTRERVRPREICFLLWLPQCPSRHSSKKWSTRRNLSSRQAVLKVLFLDRVHRGVKTSWGL